MRPWRRIVLASLGGAGVVVVAVWALATLGGGDRVSEGTSVPTTPPATAPPSAETTQPPPAGTTTSTSSTTSSTSTSTTTTTLLRVAATTTTTTTTTIDPFTPRERKEQARGDLDAILPTGDSQTDARLTDAVNRIHESLNPTYWLGESYLTDDGAKVFIAEEQAAVKLGLVVKAGGSAAATAQAATDLLVDADRILAQNEIDVAVASGGAANKIQSARDQMARAEADVTAGEFHLAIIHFRQAWQRARSASKGLNLPPVDINLSNDSVDENAPNGTVVGTLSALDLDPGDTVTFSLVDDAGGRFSIAGSDLVVADGSRLDFEADTSHDVTVRATDSAGGFLDEVFTIGVDDVNEAPTDLALDNNTVEEGQPAGTTVGTLITTDEDAGDSHTYGLAVGPGDTDNPSFQIAGDLLQTAVVFNVAADTPLSVRVRTTDAGGLFYEGALTVTVVNVNDPPDARDDDFTTDEDSALQGDVTADNGNGPDSDPDGDPLTVTEVNGNAAGVGVQIVLPSGALLTVNSNGTFGYDPNGQFESLAVGATATDSFTYQLGDGNGGFDTATVTVTITGVNDPPTANDDAGAGFTTDEDTGFTTGDVLANDTDPDTGDTLGVASFDTTGTLGLVTDNGDGTFEYDPNGQFESLAVGASDTDTFAYTVSDGNGGSDTATVTVTITGVNDPPTANDDAGAGFTTDEDTGFTTGDVLANDTDPDTGDTLGVASFDTTGTLGLVTDNGDGTFEYDPNGQFESLAVGETDTDTFAYTVSDGNGGTDTATVTVTITGVDDAPLAVDDAATVDEDDPATTIDVLGNDTDVDGGPKTIASASDPANGTVVVAGDSLSLSYEPDPDYCNDGSPTDFTYTLSPGGSTATVEVTVNCVNDPPTATAPGPFDVIGNVSITVTDGPDDLLAGASDPADGAGAQPFTVGGTVPTASVNGGDVTVDTSTGAFTYDPPPGFEGTDTFDYQVCDSGVPGSACSTPVTVTLNVSGMVWFVDASAAPGGEGRLSAPFDDLTGTGSFDASAADDPGDAVLLADGTYTGGLTLLADQTLVGDGSSSDLATLLGLTVPPYSDPLPTFSGTDPLITGSSGGLTLGSGNTVRGLDISTTGGTALLGASAGALSVSEVDSLSAANGRALDISGTSMSVDIGNVTVTSSAAGGIRLDTNTGSTTLGSVAITTTGGTGLLASHAGALTVSAGSITASSGVAVDVNQGDDNVTIGANVANTSNRSVEVTNRTGGTVTFSGLIDDDGAGILLNSNAGATITFSGGLDLDTGSNTAFTATNGGTVNVTGSTNSINTTGGTAVDITNTTIGTSGVTFRSIDVTGASNGIVLNNTGAGAFTITGNQASNPTDTTRGRTTANGEVLGSGGTIQNTTGDAVALTSASNVTLQNMVLSSNGAGSRDGVSATGGAALTLDNTRVAGFSDNGLLLSEVVGVTLQHTEVESNAKSANSVANDEANVKTIDLTGTMLIDNSVIRDVNQDNIRVSTCETAACGASLTLNVDNTLIEDTLTGPGGNDGLLVRTFNDGNVDLTVTNSTIRDNRANGVQHNTNDADSTGSTTITGSTFLGETVEINIAHHGTGTHSFNIQDNMIRQATGAVAHNGNAINIFLAGASTSTSELTGTISGNNIGNAAIADSGSIFGHGLQLFASGAGTLTARADNNTIRAIGFDSAFQAVSSSHTGTLNVTAKGNTFDVTPSSTGFALAGLDLAAGTIAGDTGTMCADITGNAAFVGDAFWAGAYITTAAGNPTVNLVGYTGSPNNQAQIEVFLDSAAINVSPPATGSFTTFLGAGTVQGQVGLCPQP